MEDRYAGDSVGGFHQKHSSGKSHFEALTNYGQVATACESTQTSNHLDFRQENASPLAVDGSTKRKREPRIFGGGLRQLTIIVCKKLESKGRTTYSEVADELVAEFAALHINTAVPLDEFDEKNIRRRVYDALNVLMALDIISRDKKEIQWKGLPSTNMNDVEETKAMHVKLMTRIQKKAVYMKDLEEQISGLKNLVLRNQQLLKCGNAPPEGFSLPFILVRTSPHATVEIEISEEMQLVHFDFNSTPFSLHDDAYILKLMRWYKLPESRLASHCSSAHLSSSGILSGDTQPFYWNSETNSEMNLN